MNPGRTLSSPAARAHIREVILKTRIVFHGVAVLFLLAVVAAAQEPKDKKNPAPAPQSSGRESSTPSVSEREAASGMATGRKSGSVVVLDRESSQPSVSEAGISAREASSGMATGRKSGAIHSADFNRSVSTARETGSGMATGRMAKPSQTNSDGNSSSRNSAHATESIEAADTDQVHTNPLYTPRGNEEANPLAQSKTKPAAGGSSSHEVIEYKDGEDGTTRTRPGNKKAN